MKDVREIRQALWQSLDMVFVKMLLFWAMIANGIIFAVLFFTSMGMDPSERWSVILTMMAVCLLPFLIFCLWRTVQTFRKAESYSFCTAKLSNPMGGRFRDSIKFRVVLEDADGCKFVADTHSIFSTHKGFMGLGFEDYVNQKVTIAYNEETENVVVIG